MFKVSQAAITAKAAMEKAQLACEAAEEAAEAARLDLLAKHRAFAEAEAAKKQLLAKLGGEAGPGGASPAASAPDPVAAIDSVVEAFAAEAGKAGLPQTVVEAIQLLRDLVVKKVGNETNDQGSKETTDNKDIIKMDVDGGAAGGGEGSGAAAASSSAEQAKPLPAANPPIQRVAPAAAAAADQWTFAQCEMA